MDDSTNSAPSVWLRGGDGRTIAVKSSTFDGLTEALATAGWERVPPSFEGGYVVEGDRNTIDAILQSQECQLLARYSGVESGARIEWLLGMRFPA